MSAVYFQENDDNVTVEIIDARKAEYPLYTDDTNVCTTSASPACFDFEDVEIEMEENTNTNNQEDATNSFVSLPAALLALESCIICSQNITFEYCEPPSDLPRPAAAPNGNGDGEDEMEKKHNLFNSNSNNFVPQNILDIFSQIFEISSPSLHQLIGVESEATPRPLFCSLCATKIFDCAQILKEIERLQSNLNRLKKEIQQCLISDYNRKRTSHNNKYQSDSDGPFRKESGIKGGKKTNNLRIEIESHDGVSADPDLSNSPNNQDKERIQKAFVQCWAKCSIPIHFSHTYQGKRKDQISSKHRGRDPIHQQGKICHPKSAEPKPIPVQLHSKNEPLAAKSGVAVVQAAAEPKPEEIHQEKSQSATAMPQPLLLELGDNIELVEHEPQSESEADPHPDPTDLDDDNNDPSYDPDADLDLNVNPDPREYLDDDVEFIVNGVALDSNFSAKKKALKNKSSLNLRPRNRKQNLDRSASRSSNSSASSSANSSDAETDTNAQEPPPRRFVPITSFKCDYCAREYYKKDFKTANGDYIFTCDLPLCKASKPFRQFAKLKRHHKINCALRPGYICEFCGKRFAQNDTLKTHVFHHHPEEVPVPVPVPIADSISDKDLKTEADFKELTEWQRKRGMASFQCEYCSRVFKKADYITENRTYHFTCDLPDCKTRKPFQRFSHLSKHHKKNCFSRPNFPCDSCDKVYSSTRCLATHVISVHTKEFKYTCHICGRPTPTLARLHGHLATHNTPKMKPFKCPSCPKRFNRKFEMQMHALRHGEKSILCEVCGKGFPNRKDLYNHSFVHETEKRFPCRICGKFFKAPNYVDTHIWATHKKSRIVRKKRGKTGTGTEEAGAGLQNQNSDFMTQSNNEGEGTEATTADPNAMELTQQLMEMETELAVKRIQPYGVRF